MRASTPVLGEELLFVAAADFGIIAADFSRSKQMPNFGRNPLGERCPATPAIAGGKLHIRAGNTLYCFGSDQTP